MSDTPNPFSVAKAEDSSGFLLWQVMSFWQRGISRELAPLGLSHAQFVLLAGLTWLRLHRSSVSQRELAEHVVMDVMTASTVLRRLEAMGLVKRSVHATDSRARDLVITARGKALAARAIGAIERFDDAFFSALGRRKRDFAQDLLTLTNTGRHTRG